MKTEVSVVAIEKIYKGLDINLFNSNERLYDAAILELHVKESRDGFIVDKVYKPTKKGTRIRFKACRSNEQLYDYKDKIRKMMSEFKAKYCA